MEYEFHKSKIPKDFSYPIKRNILEGFLENSETNRIKWVSFNFGSQKTNIVVWANFIGEAHTAGSAGNIGLYVYAVPSDERKQIETLLIEEGLPKFIEWLKKLEKLGEGWRQKTRLFEIEYKKGELKYSETE
jgi:hypothetical protein